MQLFSTMSVLKFCLYLELLSVDEDLGPITLELWPECTWHIEKLKRFIFLILKINLF